MLRSLTLSRPCLHSGSATVVAQQRRFKSKMFVRRKGKNGKTFFILNPERKFNARKPSDSELFVINDLLLDLDAEDCTGVRGLTEEDESHMEKHWKVDPLRQRVRSWVDGLEDQVNHSRQKAFETSNRPMSPWRVRKHDTLSLALRGVISSETRNIDAKAPESVGFDKHGGSEWQELNTVDAVLSENVVPRHAEDTDATLLDWLRLRQSITEVRQRRNKAIPSQAQMIAALPRQTSLVEVRRLITQSLASGFDARTFDEELCAQIRATYESALESLSSDEAKQHELLAFLGTLRQQLSSKGVFLGGPLCGLGLMVSAMHSKPNVTIDYLRLGFKHDIWLTNIGFLDASKTMMEFHQMLELASPTSQNPHEQQTMLQALTGGAKGEACRESFRSVAMAAFQGQVDTEAWGALNYYKWYTRLLAKLGALATLWKEWHLIPSLVQGRFIENGGLDSSTAKLAIRDALMEVDPSTVSRYNHVAADLDFAGCVALDSQVMEARSAGQRSNEHENTHPTNEFDHGISRMPGSAMELPLDMWLKEVTKAPG